MFAKAQKIEWKRDALKAQEETVKPNFLRAAVATTVSAALIVLPHVAQAAEAAATAITMTDRIRRAAQPIMDLATACSYPVCYVMVSCGFIMIMVGKREAGFQLIRNGAIGFVGLQFVPILMSILLEVARAIQGV